MKKILIIAIIGFVLYKILVKLLTPKKFTEAWWLAYFANYPGIRNVSKYSQHGSPLDHLARLKKFHPEKIIKS